MHQKHLFNLFSRLSRSAEKKHQLLENIMSPLDQRQRVVFGIGTTRGHGERNLTIWCRRDNRSSDSIAA